MKSSETLMLQDVWRQAALRGQAGLTIQFKSNGGAHRARLQLYSCVRKIREGLELDDYELTKAVETLEITWINDHTLRVAPKDSNDAMQGIMGALGKKPDDYQDPEIAASAQRMLDSLMSGADAKPALGGHQDNTYYGKRD